MSHDLVDILRNRLANIPPQDLAAFITAEAGNARKRSTQETLVRDLRAYAEGADTSWQVDKRIELVSTHLTLTQVRQELELERQQILAVLGDLDAETSRALLADVDARLRQLAVATTRKVIESLKTANRLAGGHPAQMLPKHQRELDPAEHSAAALAVQHESLLRYSLGTPGSATSFRTEIPSWAANLALAQRMLAAHHSSEAASLLEQRVATLTRRIASAATPEELRSLRADVLHVVQDVQVHVENALHRMVRQNETRKQNRLVAEAVAQWLARPDGELTKGAGPVLSRLFEQAGHLDGLREAIAVHEDRHDLEQLLTRLHVLKRHEVVQGVFLPEDGSGRGGDERFLAATESAWGNYNCYENLGKFVYHVTALGEILRNPGSGPSTANLAPALSGTSVTNSDAALISAQDKMLTSTRKDLIRRLIDQQEADAEGTAQESAAILRFPIRTRHLGEFDQDLITLADNLWLLESDMVPPEDLELLVHADWVSITNEDFQATYNEMFGLPT